MSNANSFFFFYFTLQDLKHLIDNDNRKAFQSKKHVSLDVKHSKLLEGILRGGSSSDEEDKEIHDKRKDFQSRKHQSLDSRVTFKFDKEPSPTSTSDDDWDVEKRSLIGSRDITKPVIIDLKDFDSSEDEDFLTTRKSFQQQRTISTDSRKR